MEIEVKPVFCSLVFQKDLEKKYPRIGKIRQSKMVRSTKNLLERMTTLKRCSRPFNNECEVAGGPRPPTTFRELHDIERQRTQHRILSKILDCGSSPNKNEGEEKA